MVKYVEAITQMNPKAPMKKHIINLSELEYLPRPAAMGASPEGYDVTVAYFAGSIGAQKLGYNMAKIPAGKRGFPFHNHRVNEEMFFIVKGAGEVRIGSERFPIKEGDFIAAPPGGPELAHQIINTGTEELQYLSVSTKLSPEIAEYPDGGTGKFGVLADFGVGADGKPQGFRFIGNAGESGDYWSGEEVKENGAE
jgi:uncharacterized cupin superfamily protein